MNHDTFQGPLFIVGMPRSGTKLLRDLLNRHPRISICTVESEFIPYLVRTYGADAALSPAQLLGVHARLRQSAFYFDLAERDVAPSAEAFVQACAGKGWPEVFAFVLKRCGPKPYRPGMIWGDKTPGYLNHIPLLKTLFPAAKFIHIIRDPRDYGLSAERTWGKNLFRAAHRWRYSIQRAREIGAGIAEDYLEVRYEDLLGAPVAVMEPLTSFLGLRFDPAILTLDQPAENYGAAKGTTRILEANANKFETDLRQDAIRRIEEITYPVLRSLNYTVLYARREAPLTPAALALYQLQDGWKSIWFHVRDKGLITGVRYFVMLYRQSSWRLGWRSAGER